jgi:hypothetical protein
LAAAPLCSTATISSHQLPRLEGLLVESELGRVEVGVVEDVVDQRQELVAGPEELLQLVGWRGRELGPL